MSAFTLNTIYKAVDKFSGPLKAMQAANARFSAAQSKSLTALRSSFTDVRNRLIGLAGNLSTAALMMTGFNAIKDFDESLASLRAITGLTGKAFIPFKQEIMAIGDSFKMAYPEVSKAMELMGSLDATLLNSADDMGMMTRSAVLLSRASGAELPQSAQSLVSILKIFGDTAKDAARYVDILSTSEQKGTFTVSQLADGLKTVGGTARVLGMNVDQTAALLQALAPSTKSVEVASTGLNSILNKLGTTTKKQFNPSIVGSAKAIQNLSDANLTLKQAQDMVGAERAGMLLALINQNKVVQDLTDKQYNLGNAQKQADERAKSFTFKIEQLTAKFKNLAITGNENSGMLNGFGKIIGFITNHLGAMLAIIGTSLVAYGAYYTAMTLMRLATVGYNIALGVFMVFQKSIPIAIGKNIIALKAYGIAARVATAAQWLWNIAMTANPIGIIIVAIAALIAGIILLVKNWDKVKAKMDEWSNSAVFQILSLFNPIMKIVELIGFFQDRWKGIKKAFAEGGILGGLKAIGKTLLSFVLKPLEVILRAVGKIPGMKWASNASEKIAEFRGGLDKDLLEPKKEEVKPVNTVAAANDMQTQRFEEVTKNNLNIELNNKTDKQANVKFNPAKIPVTTNTY
jgi:hypothetical protein